MKTFSEYFDIILNGDKEASRQAARQVRKLLYSSQDGGKFKAIASIIENAPQEYGKILEEWRRENFVMAVSVLYFLHNKESQPDFLFPWLYGLIQDPNGNIRHSAVRMFKNELGPLTVHIRLPGHRPGYFGKPTPEQADAILYSLFINLNRLLNALWQPKHKRYKYIDSLLASSYKSVQMILAQLEEYCGQKYIDRFVEQYY